MLRSMISGVAGLKAHQTEMDVIGNNIANVNTYGFKSSRVTFRDVYYQTLTNGSTGSGSTGATNATQVGYGSNVASIDLLNTRSGYTTTGKATDCYIDGEGYFVLQDTAGNEHLTRVGQMDFDGSGNLVDPSGNFVCGYQADATGNIDTTKAPAKISDASFGELTNIAISADGKITGEKTDGTIVTIGQLAIANVPNPQSLTQEGSTYFKANANSGTVTYSTPGSGNVGALKTSGLEMSNVDLSNELSNMIMAQRGFQANSKLITVSDEMLDTLINMKR